MEQGTKARMLYVDALRGLTMFLVVYHHVIDKIFRDDTLLDQTLQSFRMPVFFFVSGFVAYKALEFWTGKNTLKRFVKKFRSQVIPTVIFFCAYFYFMRGCNPILLFLEYGWRQYWFTIVLFEFFVIYFSVNYLTRNHPKANVVILVTLSVVSVMIYHGCKKGGLFCLYTDAYEFTRYFPFFIAGTLIRKCYDVVIKYLDKWAVIIGVIALFLIQVPAFDDFYHLPEKINNFITIWSIRVTGFVMVFGLFVKLRDFFTDSSKITKVMCYVGTRTLDIYLMHFFFISHLPILNLYLIKQYGVHLGRPSLIVVSALVVCACLAVSYIIRKSKFLGNLLFAAK